MITVGIPELSWRAKSDAIPTSRREYFWFIKMVDAAVIETYPGVAQHAGPVM